MEKARSIILSFNGDNDENIVDELQQLLWKNADEIDEQVTDFLLEMQQEIVEDASYGGRGYKYEALQQKAEQLTEMIAEMQSANWR